MGTDLYIRKLDHEKQITGFRTDVDVGYFRDAYNATSLLEKLGMSYWQIAREWNVEDDLSIEQVKRLYKEVIERKPILDKFLNNLDEKWLKGNNCSIEDGGVSGWKEYFTNKYAIFVRFLEKAIELESPLVFSV